MGDRRAEVKALIDRIGASDVEALHQILTRRPARSKIRSRIKMAARLWEWAPISEAFSGLIAPCDIDGIVEINGHFLVIEAKPPGDIPEGGQRLVLDALGSIANVTVIVLYGDPMTGIASKWQHLSDGHGNVLKENSKSCEMRDVIAFCSDWEARARAARAA